MSNKAKNTAMKNDGKPALTPKLRFPEFRDAAGEWKETSVDEISNTAIAGGTPSTSEKNFWGGEIRWMNSGELNHKKVYEVQGRITVDGLKNSSTKVVPPRCVLIGLAGQGKTRGTVAMNMVELCTNQSIAAIFPNDLAFNSNFLYHNLDMRYEELRRLSAGGEGRGGLNLQIIKSLRVILPTLPEQQKIADCLTSVDKLITAQARKVDALKTHKKGLMQQLFPREGETRPRLRFPEFQGAGEWEDVPLSKLVGSLDAGVSVNSGDRSATSGEIGVLKTSAVTNGIFEPQENKVVFDEVEIGRVKESVQADTIIISRMNTPALVGASAYVESSLENIFLPDRLWAAKSKPGTSMRFVAIILGSNKGRAALSKLAKGSSGSMKNITKPDVLAFMIMAPSPTEQQRITDCLTSLDDIIAVQTQKLGVLKTHKKGLMQQLFPSMEDA